MSTTKWATPVVTRPSVRSAFTWRSRSSRRTSAPGSLNPGAPVAAGQANHPTWLFGARESNVTNVNLDEQVNSR